MNRALLYLALLMSLGVFAFAACGDDDDGASVTPTRAATGTGTAGTATATEEPEPEYGPGISDTEIKLGGTNTITGVASAVCGPVSDATAKWFDHVNADGGVNGRQINFNLLDDGYDAARGATNVRRLVEEDGVFAMVSGCGTPAVSAVLEYASENNVPYVGAYSAAENMIIPPKDSVFAVLPPLHLQEKSLLPWAFEEYGPGTVATVNGQQSEIFIDTVREAVEGAGGSIVAEVPITIGQAEFGSVVLQLIDADADYVLMMGASATDAARLVQEMERQQYKPKIKMLGQSSQSDATFLTNAGAYANDMMAIAAVTVLPGEEGSTDCEEALGVARGTLTQFQQYGCAVGQIVTAAFEQLGNNLTQEAFLDLLGSEDFTAEVSVLPGEVVGSPSHLLTNTIRIYGVENGAFVYLSDPIQIETE